MSFLFLTREQVRAMHHANIERFGGAHGVRDEGAFESALFAAENRFYYEDANVFQCAAAYGFHLSQAHAFIDGNKRVAAAATLIFLELNGFSTNANDERMTATFLALASGEMSREGLETFLRETTISRT